MKAKTRLGIWTASALASAMALTATSVSAQSQFEFIPADTFLYAGSDKPYPLGDLIKFITADSELLLGALASHIKEAPESERVAIERFLAFMASPEVALKSNGIGTNVQYSAYMSGFTPVLRFSLIDAQIFSNWIVEVENTLKVTPNIDSINGIQFRRYGAKRNAANGNIILAVTDSQAVLTLDIGSESDLRRALGIDKPQRSFASEGTVAALNRAWNYSGQQTWFFDAGEFVAKVTSPSDDQAQLMNKALDESGVSASSRQSITTQACRDELTALSATWPRVVGGYRNFSVADERFSADIHAALEVDHPKLLSLLDALRGHISPVVKDSDSLFAVALGLDLERAPSVLNEINLMLGQLNFECPLLSEVNDMGAAMLPVLMGAGALNSLAQGISGFSFTVQNLNVDASLDTPKVSNVDALVSLATPKPRMALQSLKRVPYLESLEVSADGSATEVGPALAAKARQIGSDLTIKTAQHGQHLTLFTGEQGSAAAMQLADEPLDKNGIFYMKVDLERVVSELSESVAIQENVKDERAQEIYQTMSMLLGSGSAAYAIDVSERGIEVETQLSVQFEPGAPQAIAEFFDDIESSKKKPPQTDKNDALERTVATASVEKGEIYLETPNVVPAGSRFSVTWKGPTQTLDYLTMIDSDGAKAAYVTTANGSPAKFLSPRAPGAYQLAYIDGKSGNTLAAVAVEVTALSATIEAPSKVPANADFDVVWTGPNNLMDLISIVDEGAEDGASGDAVAMTSNGSPATLRAPQQSGRYEIRYISMGDTITTIPLEVTEP